MPDSTLFFLRLIPLPFSFLYYRGRIAHHNIKGIVNIQRFWKQRNLRKQDQPYLVIHDAWSTNYYHWMTQALPRLVLAKQVYSQFVLLLPQNCTSDFHLESLRVLGLTEWTFLEIEKTYYRVENLIYPAHDIQVGDYNEAMIRNLAEIFRKGLKSEPNQNFIFVHRLSKEGRQIINEEETLNTFRHHKFSVVYFEQLSFTEQREMAHGACVLAGVHGAGLTNMLFMTKGSVFELTSELKGEQYYYFTLSNVLGHEYYYQHCESDTNNTIQQADILVNIELLERNLSMILNKH